MIVYDFLPLLLFIDTQRWSSALLTWWRIWLWHCDANTQVHTCRDGCHHRTVQTKEREHQQRLGGTRWLIHQDTLCLFLFCSYSSIIRIEDKPTIISFVEIYVCIDLSELFVCREMRFARPQRSLLLQSSPPSCYCYIPMDAASGDRKQHLWKGPFWWEHCN